MDSMDSINSTDSMKLYKIPTIIICPYILLDTSLIAVAFLLPAGLPSLASIVAFTRALYTRSCTVL